MEDKYRAHACQVTTQSQWQAPWLWRISTKDKFQKHTGPRAPPIAMSATPATQNDRGCEIVPRLPRETKVDVTKCHACHAKCRGVTRDYTGPKGATQCHECHACHAKRPWMWDCATPATWNESGCHQAPRLPRKVPRHHARLRATKPGTRAPPSAMKATPARQNDRGCEIAPRLPRETKADVTKCHACHAKCRGVTRDYARLNRAQGRHPVPWVPRLPRKTTVDVRLRHACHVKRGWMSPGATPATQSAAASRATTRD